jgi:hypothetical protein
VIHFIITFTLIIDFVTLTLSVSYVFTLFIELTMKKLQIGENFRRSIGLQKIRRTSILRIE